MLLQSLDRGGRRQQPKIGWFELMRTESSNSGRLFSAPADIDSAVHPALIICLGASGRQTGIAGS
jgi:hypothetical protein